ncbi:MAG: hypothetical protein M3P93_07585 [Actinomycetota bacterium]|nr:hypothetical protein [Actinomycetota bacterium]
MPGPKVEGVDGAGRSGGQCAFLAAGPLGDEQGGVVLQDVVLIGQDVVGDVAQGLWGGLSRRSWSVSRARPKKLPSGLRASVTPSV